MHQARLWTMLAAACMGTDNYCVGCLDPGRQGLDQCHSCLHKAPLLHTSANLLSSCTWFAIKVSACNCLSYQSSCLYVAAWQGALKCVFLVVVLIVLGTRAMESFGSFNSAGGCLQLAEWLATSTPEQLVAEILAIQFKAGVGCAPRGGQRLGRAQLA